MQLSQQLRIPLLLGGIQGDYLLGERRRRLLAVDWVKDASVSRRWPNRVSVNVIERRPVAFAQIAGDWAAGPRAMAWQ